MLAALGRELAYVVAMPFMLALSVIDDHWPAFANRIDDFCDEVANVHASRRR